MGYPLNVRFASCGYIDEEIFCTTVQSTILSSIEIIRYFVFSCDCLPPSFNCHFSFDYIDPARDGLREVWVPAAFRDKGPTSLHPRRHLSHLDLPFPSPSAITSHQNGHNSFCKGSCLPNHRNNRPRHLCQRPKKAHIWWHPRRDPRRHNPHDPSLAGVLLASDSLLSLRHGGDEGNVTHGNGW